MSIGFSRRPPGNPLDGTDSSFLQRLEWDDSAPKKLIKASRKGDVTRFVLAYRSWLEPFAGRFRKRAPGVCMLLGLLPGSAATSDIESLVGEYVNGSAGEPRYGLGRAIVGWVQSVATSGIQSDIERRLIAELLLNPPVDLEAETWCRLWRLVLLAEPSSDDDIASSLESSIVVGLLFGPLRNADAEVTRAAVQLGQLLLDSTDNDGSPTAAAFIRLTAWLTPFVRAGWWGKSFKRSVLEGDTGDRFRDVIARATELICGDGCFAFDAVPGSARTLLPLAAKVAGWSKQTPVGSAARFLSLKKDVKNSRTALPSSQSDWGMTAHLRSSRKANADLVALTHNKKSVQLSICAQGTPIVVGEWATRMKVSGKVVRLTGEWSCSCWYSDKDGDFIELEQTTGNVRLTRQIFLSRTGSFLLLMDAIQTTRTGAIRYESSLPLAQRVMARADFISREWRLHTGDMPVRVFPVSLAFDRVQSCAGGCDVAAGALRFTAEGKTAVNTALVLDWHPDRTVEDAEWTGLTVTENRKVVSPSGAAAFRLRLGEHQVVGYRNIDGSRELRAVLGQHTGRETLIGLLTAGQFEPLVLVDAGDDEG
jgi:hypothetical protein